MAKRTIGRRLDAALLALSLQAQGPAVDATKDRISSSKPSTQPPPNYGDDHAVWLDRAERLVEGAEGESRPATGRAPGLPRKTATELRRVIRNYEGRDNIYVAYHEGCSEGLVRKVRSELRLDGMGFRLAVDTGAYAAMCEAREVAKRDRTESVRTSAIVLLDSGTTPTDGDTDG